jgi:transcriptional regulator with PAS, ATPase and Fis domain
MSFIESLDAMALIDRKGKYVYVNQGWVKITGVSAEEALTKYVWEVFPDTHSLRVLETGKPAIGKSVNYKGIPAFTNYFPYFTEDGQIAGCFLYSIITCLAHDLDLAHQVRWLASQLAYYRQELSRERGARYDIDKIIGESPAVRNLKSQIIAAAKSNSTVLIEGETGTGKELIAHSIHSLSPRCTSNFVRVNCSAIPSELMESEFFGYVGGAFTGASKKGKPGRFELANKGSIFLDEINLLASTMQPKFLRVLQEMEIEPVGGDKSIHIDVRVIAASNIPLECLVERGDFRKDLFYRLNVIRITAPPLRERKEDIPLLAENLLVQLNNQLGMVISGFGGGVIQVLQNYDWPGNIRELRNMIESAMNRAHSRILQKGDFEQLRKGMQVRNQLDSLRNDEYQLKNSKASFEREMVCDALRKANGNRVKTAQILGISRTVLYKKIAKYDLNKN